MINRKKKIAAKIARFILLAIFLIGWNFFFVI